MKSLKLFFLSVLTLGLSVSSCSSDNSSNDEQKTSASIIGKWEITRKGNVLNGDALLLPYKNEGGCSNDNIEYVEDGKYKENQYEYANSKCKTYNNDGTWSKGDDILTTKDILGNTFKYEILKLDDTTLRIKIIQGVQNPIYSVIEYTRM